MSGMARLGDRWSGICCCHAGCISMGGPIIQGSGDTRTNGLGQARLGDIVVGDCGHVGFIITSSQDVRANGLGVARLGDQISSGCLTGVIIQGSGDTRANG